MYYLIFQIKTNKGHQSGVLARQPHQKILWSICIWSRCWIFIILDGIWVIMKDSQYFQVPVELGELYLSLAFMQAYIGCDLEADIFFYLF